MSPQFETYAQYLDWRMSDAYYEWAASLQGKDRAEVLAAMPIIGDPPMHTCTTCNGETYLNESPTITLRVCKDNPTHVSILSGV